MTLDLAIFDIEGYSTYTCRFAEVLATLCTKAPPLEMCAAWLTSGNDALQDFVSCNSKISWTQAIVTIDAACLMAEHCEEGRSDLLAEGAEYAVAALRTAPIKMTLSRRNGWKAVTLPEGVTQAALDTLLSNDLASVDSAHMLALADHFGA